MFPELDRAIRFISNVTESYSTVLLAVDKGRLKVVSYHSLGNTISARKSVNIMDSGIYSVILRKQQPYVIHNYDRDPSEFFFYSNEEGIKSVMLIPIREKGVLHIDSKRAYIFPDKMVRILQEFTEVLEDVMESVALKMENRELSRELKILEVVVELWPESNPRTILERIMETSGADVGFITHSNGGSVLVDIMIPEKFIKNEPVSPGSIVYKITKDNKPFFIERLRNLTQPIFWERSSLNGKIKSIISTPYMGKVMGFCSLYAGKRTNLKLLLKPLSLLSTLLTSREEKESGDPLTGFMDFKSLSKATREKRYMFVDVKVKNLVEIYEVAGPQEGDRFIKELSNVLKKVSTFLISSEVLYGRPSPHHFRVAIPKEDKGRSILKPLEMALENLSNAMRSKYPRIKPIITVEFTC